MARHRRKTKKPTDEVYYRINEKIFAKQVRVVEEGVGQKVCSTEEAIKMARDRGLDLVEISPKASPPVCKIVEYKKFLYEQKKKKKEIKSKATKVVVKEIRYGPNTEEHDFLFKLKHAKKFIAEGSKIKAYVFFKGRSILFKQNGEILLLRLAQELADVADVEGMPKMEGKRMIMFLAPKKVN